MLEKIKKIPAGTFLVPMIISMILYTFWPDLFKIGGVTESLLSGAGTGFIVGMMVFAAGTTIDFSKLRDLIRHQGSLLLFKLIWSTILAFAYLYFFGDDGILGISGIAFITTIISVNPAIHLSIVESLGDPRDAAAYGIVGLLALPAIPLIIYSFYDSGSMASIDWMPVISILGPLFAGIILGNIDRNFAGLFGPSLGALMPLLGWNLGQGMNINEALQSGGSGLILTLIFLVLMIPLFFFDSKVLDYDGVSGIGMMNVAGVSTAVPIALATSFPQLEQYLTSANAQVLMACIITSIITPFIAQRRYKSVYGEEALREKQAVE